MKGSCTWVVTNGVPCFGFSIVKGWVCWEGSEGRGIYLWVLMSGRVDGVKGRKGFLSSNGKNEEKKQNLRMGGMSYVG